MRRLVFAVVVLVGLATALPAASAHSFLVGSDPPQGAVLATAPTRATLEFSEKVAVDLTKISLVDAGGTVIAGTSTSVDPKHNRVIVVTLPKIGDGTYRLRFVTRDPVDLHETSGSIVFAVGKAANLLPPDDLPPGPPISIIVIRWLLLGAFALIVGPLVIALVTLRDAPPDVRAGLVAFARRAAVAGVGLQWLLLVVEALLIDAPFGKTLGSLVGASDYGKRVIAFTLVAFGGALLLKPVVVALRENRALRWTSPEVAAAALMPAGLAVVEAFGGHSSARSFAFGVVVRSFHLAAGGLWVGGLLTIVVLTIRPPGGGEPFPLVALARRFTPIAVVATGVLVVSGLVLAGRGIVSLTALFATQYGWTLLAKLVLLVAALWLGAIRWHRIEMYLAAGVLLGGTALAATAPALGDRYLPPRTIEAAQPPSVTIGETLVAFTLEPGRPSTGNLVTLRLLSSLRPTPTPVASVTATVTLPGGTSMQLRGGPFAWGAPVQIGSIDIANAGPYRVDLVLIGAQGPQTVTLNGTIAPLVAARHRVIVSSARVETPIYIAAGAVAAGLGGWGIVRRRVSRTRRLG